MKQLRCYETLRRSVAICLCSENKILERENNAFLKWWSRITCMQKTLRFCWSLLFTHFNSWTLRFYQNRFGQTLVLFQLHCTSYTTVTENRLTCYWTSKSVYKRSSWKTPPGIERRTRKRLCVCSLKVMVAVWTRSLPSSSNIIQLVESS